MQISRSIRSEGIVRIADYADYADFWGVLSAMSIKDYSKQ